jgi:hypothetical protein
MPSIYFFSKGYLFVQKLQQGLPLPVYFPLNNHFFVNILVIVSKRGGETWILQN